MSAGEKDCFLPRDLDTDETNSNEINAERHISGDGDSLANTKVSNPLELNGDVGAKLDDIVKVSVTLSPDEPPPTAFDLFYLNFDVEMARVPTHFRMQRWSKRRIANRWKWITSREREAYETKAEGLKKQWLALRNHSGNKNGGEATVRKVKSCGTLLSEKRTIRSLEAKQDGKRKRERAREKMIELIASGESFEESDERAKKNAHKMSKEDQLLFHGLEDNKKARRNKRKKRTRQLSPIHMEDFLSETKDDESSKRSCRTKQSTHTSSPAPNNSSTSAPSWRQQRYEGPALNVIQRQQLHHYQQTIEREIAAQHGVRQHAPTGTELHELDDTRSVQSVTSSGSSTVTISSCASSVASVPLDPRRDNKQKRRRKTTSSRKSAAEKMEYVCLLNGTTRERETEVSACDRSVVSSDDNGDGSSSSSIASTARSPSSSSTPLLTSVTSSSTSSSHGSLFTSTSTHKPANPATERRLSAQQSHSQQVRANDSRFHSDRSSDLTTQGPRRHSSNQHQQRVARPNILDHISFRKKCSNDIQSGSTVFSCVPCTNNYTHTLLFDAQSCLDILGLNESCLAPRGNTAKSSSSTARNFTSSHDIEAQTNLLNEMRDFCALEFGKNNGVLVHEKAFPHSQCTLYLVIQFHARESAFNAHAHCIQKTENRIDFVEEWFSCAYFARQSYSRSDVGSHCLIRFKNKGRKCRCDRPRSAHLHATCTHSVNDLAHHPNPFEPCSSRNCILFCCCSLFDTNLVSQYTSHEPKTGDVVLWRGTKCTVECVISSTEIGVCDDSNTTHIVPTSALSKVISFSYTNDPLATTGTKQPRKMPTIVAATERCVKSTSDLDEAFDSYSQLVDGLTVTQFFKNFWLRQGNLSRCKLLFP